MNMKNLLLQASGNNAFLYIIVSVLIISNLILIVLYIIKMVKYNKLEEKVETELIKSIDKEKLSSRYDKNQSEPINIRPATNPKKYIIEETEKTGGYYIKEKRKKNPVAYAKTKPEANEILRNLAKDDN